VVHNLIIHASSPFSFGIWAPKHILPSICEPLNLSVFSTNSIGPGIAQRSFLGKQLEAYTYSSLVGEEYVPRKGLGASGPRTLHVRIRESTLDRSSDVLFTSNFEDSQPRSYVRP
jgi:hypothetical protein